MNFVVDTSVAIKWLIDEPGSDAADALRGHDLVAPALLRIEAANVLRTLTAKGALQADDAGALFDLLQDAPMDMVDPDDGLETRALDLALELGHPVYDCLYLALAERLDRTLITADKRFLKALGASRHESRAVDLDTWGRI